MPPLSSSKREAVAALKRGEAVIFPTETVYGLGVSVEAAASPEALYDLKERDRGKPVSWLVGGVDDLDRYGAHVPDLARRLARAYWPGPLTLIVAVGCPLATTSANISGLQAPGAFDALDPRLAARVGVVVPDDTDDDKSGVASTVLDCTVNPPRILREGAVAEADIRAVR